MLVSQLETSPISFYIAFCKTGRLHFLNYKIVLGAGHGLSSILQMLLNFPEHFGNRKDVETVIHQAVDYVLSCEMPNGNYPPVPGEVRNKEDELLHWCHGAPGVVYLLAKAFLTWKDEKYLQAAKKCAEITWQKGLLRKGPGICHGVAGTVL